MAVGYPLQASFARGELTERLHARADIDHWKVGLAECLNFYIMRQAGARRRPGTQFVASAAVTGASDIVRLVPWVFSPDQAYVLELSDELMRFFTLGGQVLDTGVPYEIATPWAAADLEDLQFVQSADVVYVTHQSYAPRKIIRNAETDWEIQLVEFEDGPWGNINTEPTILTPSSRGSLIPSMTNNTTPAGYTASDSDGSVYAYTVFDGSDTGGSLDSSPSGGGGGSTGTVTVYWQIQMGTARVVDGYHIRNANGKDAPRTAPRSWEVLGSNNGSTWVTLDAVVGEIDWGPGETRFYLFDNATAYTYYRLEAKGNNADPADVSVGADNIAIAEWSLKGGGANEQTVTITASSTDGINDGQGFLSTDVGRHIRLYEEANAYWHWGVIASRSSSTSITVTMKTPPFASTRGFSKWRLGAFSDTTGYPRAVSFFQERLVYGGTPDMPQTVWASVVGGFDTFSSSIPLVPDDAFQFTLSDVSPIQWIIETSEIVIGTSSSIRILGPADKNEGLSATNIQQGKPVRSGTRDRQPVQVGEAALFPSRNRKAVRELIYSFDAGGYIAPDASVLSEHITSRGVKQIAAAPAPNANVWLCLDDGTLACMTYEREQQMLAITPHAISGGTDDAVVESIAAIPASDRFEVWLCVKRTKPDASIMRSIEYFVADFEREEQPDAFFVDCGLTYEGSAATTITGLSHLNGFTVDILADGRTHAQKTVSGGSVTLDYAASTVHVGLPFTSRLTTLPASQAFGDGTAMGRRRNVGGAIVHFLETGQARVKATGSRDWTELIPQHDTASRTLVTGSRDVKPLPSQWSQKGQITIEVNTPQPCTILGVTVAYDTEP